LNRPVLRGRCFLSAATKVLSVLRWEADKALTDEKVAPARRMHSGESAVTIATLGVSRATVYRLLGRDDAPI
jgi:hypothetical protein